LAKVESEDHSENLVAEAVVAQIVANARRNPDLMNILKATAAQLKQRHEKQDHNIGFMSEIDAIEFMLQASARQFYRDTARAKWQRPN
jgi:hypothetical protein